MNILYITNIPSPYRVSFFNELSKECKLTVIFERKTAKDRDKSWFKLFEMKFEYIFLKGIHFKNDTAINFGIIKYLFNKKYDIIVLGGYSTPTGILVSIILRLFKRKYILSVDGGFINERESILKRKFKETLISSASYWLSTGAMTNKYLEFYGAIKEKIHFYHFTSLYNSDLVVEKYSKNEYRKLLGITEEYVVLFIGQFIKRKGFDLLLQIGKKLPKNVGLYLIGGEENFQQSDYYKIANSNENIHLLEFKTKQELSNYFKSSDIFILPTREDIWGLVINEAMSFGLPIITTKMCNAGNELIKDYDNGFIVDLNETEILNRIHLLISGNIDLDQIFMNNLNKIKSYSFENMVKDHLELFKKINNNGILGNEEKN